MKAKKMQDIFNTIDLQDEKQVNKILWKNGFYFNEYRFPLASLQLELTECCNMKCLHCYNDSNKKEKNVDIMTSERWISFARYLVAHGGVFECVLSGGEPLLLGDDLFEIMDILDELGTCFMLITNGYLLTEEKVKRLKKYRYHWLQISIDGVDASYNDEFRQLRGSWLHAVNAAKYVVKYGIPLKIAHCVTPQNIQNIDEMCELAYDIGANCIMVGEVCFSGRAARNTDLLLSVEQRKYMYKKVADNAIKYKGRMKVKCSNSVKKGLERHKEKPFGSAVIRPNGDVRLDGMAPFVAGNILREEFAEIWMNKIDKSWKNPIVQKYINQFDSEDRNYSFTNYIEKDIYL